MATTKNDVLILGGGVIGLSCALVLRKAGVPVRVLEQNRVGSGSSHGNCGTLTPSHADPLAMPGMIRKALYWMLRRDAPLYVNPRPDFDRLRWLLGFARRCNWRDFEHAARARAAILLDSRRGIERWQATEGIDCDFAADGALYVYRDAVARKADQHHVELMRRLGIPVQEKTGDEVLAMEPALKPGVAAGILHPGDARLRPDRYVAGLARRVRELGGVIEEHCTVDDFLLDSQRVRGVKTGRDEHHAERVVLALGAWSPLLAKRLELRLPMQPGKGYSITYSRPSIAPARPLTLCEDSVCVTTWPSGFRLGSTMEFSGFDTTLNRTRLDALRRGAARYLHQPEGGTVEEEWWGWRPMSVDELPIIGQSTRWQNLLYATAHGMMGMSMSTTTAELVMAAICGSTPPIDPAPYRPGRFKL